MKNLQLDEDDLLTLVLLIQPWREAFNSATFLADHRLIIKNAVIRANLTSHTFQTIVEIFSKSVSSRIKDTTKKISANPEICFRRV